MRDSDAPRRWLAFGLGCGVSALLLGLCYRLVSTAPTAPGDYLLSLRGPDGSARFAPDGGLFAMAIDAFDLWASSPAVQRLCLLAACYAGGALLGLILVTVRVRAEAVFFAMTTFGFLPWLTPDPTAFGVGGTLLIPLVLAMAAGVAARVPRFPAWALFGVAGGLVAGWRPALGEALLVAAVASRAGASPWSLVAGVAIWAGTVHVPSSGSAAAMPDANALWYDVGLECSICGPWAVQLLLAWLAGMILLRRRFVVACGVVLTIALLVGTGFAVPRLRARVARLERDAVSLRQAASNVSWRYTDVIFLNLPLHVRPLLRSLIQDESVLGHIVCISTWDTGSELHVLPDWGGIFEGTQVVRWTSRGFVVTDWGTCLALDEFPLARDVGLSAPPMPRSAAAMLELGRLPAKLAGPASNGRVTALGSEAVGNSTSIRGHASEPHVIAVAWGGGTRVRASQRDRFWQGLARGWFRGPFTVPRIVATEGAEPRIVGRVAGYGLLLRVGPGRFELSLAAR